MYTPLDYLVLSLAVLGVSVIAGILLIHVLRTLGLAPSDFVTGERRTSDGRRVSRRRRRAGAHG
jgi:hypothetical protein